MKRIFTLIAVLALAVSAQAGVMDGYKILRIPTNVNINTVLLGGAGGSTSENFATNAAFIAVSNTAYAAYPASNPSNYCTLAAAAALTNGFVTASVTNGFVTASITNGLGGISATEGTNISLAVVSGATQGMATVSAVTGTLDLAISPSLTGTVAQAAGALQAEADTPSSVFERSLIRTNATPLSLPGGAGYYISEIFPSSLWGPAWIYNGLTNMLSIGGGPNDRALIILYDNGNAAQVFDTENPPSASQVGADPAGTAAAATNGIDAAFIAAKGGLTNNATDVTLGGWRLQDRGMGPGLFITPTPGYPAAISDSSSNSVLAWGTASRLLCNTGSTAVAQFGNVFLVGMNSDWIPVHAYLTNHEAQIAGKLDTNGITGAAIASAGGLTNVTAAQIVAAGAITNRCFNTPTELACSPTTSVDRATIDAAPGFELKLSLTGATYFTYAADVTNTQDAATWRVYFTGTNAITFNTNIITGTAWTNATATGSDRIFTKASGKSTVAIW